MPSCVAMRTCANFSGATQFLKGHFLGDELLRAL